MYDMHTHTHHSDDGSYTMEQMTEAAIQQGLSGICFTDHLDPEHPLMDSMKPYDSVSYFRELEKIDEQQKKARSSITILRGIELGLQPNALEACSSFVTGKPYDFIIGSMHVIRGVDMYMAEYREMGTSEELISFYFEELLACVKNYNDFSVLGHADVIRRYVHGKDADYSFEKVKDQLAEVFRVLIQKGKGIEINTSGLRYHLDSSTPGPKTLKLYHDLGGEIITLGSDAHRPKDVGYHFRENAEILKSIGFDHACYFKNLKPVFYNI